jgi:hypothetical protein
MAEETEENNDGTWTGLKKTIIGIITTLIMTVAGIITTKLTGGGDEPATAQPATPVINIMNNNQQTQSGGWWNYSNN